LRLLITTDVAGGVWSYTEELVDALTARGHAVALVSLGGEPTPAHRAWLAARPTLDFTALDAPLEWMAEPEPALSASVEALRQVVRRVRPDVIHLNQFFYGAHDLGAPKLVVAHSDVVSWWEMVKRESPPDDAWFRRYRGWVRDGLAGADARVAPSAWMARTAERIYGAGPVRAIHNARTAAPYAAAARTEREPLVVAAGRLWDEAKGARDLADAAARLGGAGRVIVAGPATSPDGSGERFPTDAPGVEWAGVLASAELRALLGRAAVYVGASRYEPFGLAPLEAALAGCALVLADIDSFRELWDDCALFYPPGDGATLAHTLRALLGDPARRAALAAAAQDRARERYAAERMAAEYEAIYHELLAPAGPLNPES
jgi:glycosyltransferase involved in cell wall biosynthesis